MTGKRMLALLMSMLMLFSAYEVLAEGSDGYEFNDLGQKTAEALVKPGQYEITVSVPGAVASDKYSEVIVMVDASSSQGANLDKLKAILVDLAKDILHNDGSMRLTLMGFGMGPRNVGSFYNASTLEAYLAGVTQADLRQGVSATNCESALRFVHEYINKSEKLGQTYVIFTSDGNANMDETTFSLLTWKAHPEWYYQNKPASYIYSYAAGGQADLLLSGGPILTPTAMLYPEECLAIEVAAANYGVDSEVFAAKVEELYNKITANDESGMAYVDAVYADAQGTNNPDYMLSTSEYEKVFMNYGDGCMYNAFLCTIHRMVNVGFYPDWYNLSTWGSRAATAADELANNDKVLELMMLDFANKTKTWMNPASSTAHHVTASNINYQPATNYTAAVEKISDLAEEMFTTVYENATVVDPMSKWVTLDPSSIRIYKDEELIYQYGQGWLYEDKQPAANPITLTQNADGRYTITWRIKDGHLLYTDRYFLKYVVDVDEAAEGFVYGMDYPANDPTHVEYTDENGNEQEKNIQVPDVKENTQPDSFGDEELGLRIYKGTDDSKPLNGILFDVYKVVPSEGDQLTPQPSYEEYGQYATSANLVVTLETDGAGYAAYNMTAHGHGEGFYLIIERDNAKIKEPVAPFYIHLPMPDPATGELMNVVDIYPKNEPIPEEEPDIPPVIPDEEEPEDEGRLTIIKHSQTSQSAVLNGAVFQVYRMAENGETAALTTNLGGEEVGIVPLMIGGSPVTFETDANGVGTSAKLPFGLYFIVETQAPAGYNLLDAPIPVFVTGTSVEIANAVYVANVPGVQLPETGGMGTRLFTISGLTLCGIAVLMLMRSSRRSV